MLVKSPGVLAANMKNKVLFTSTHTAPAAKIDNNQMRIKKIVPATTMQKTVFKI